MPSSPGTATMDIRSILGHVVNFARSKTPRYAIGTCDGLILKMHYRWSFLAYLAGFLSVWYSWYHRDVITCVSHYNADVQVRLDYVNICLSYPYIGKDGSRRYILFYRWIHWIFLVLAGLYYVPRQLSKSFENPKTKQILEKLAVNSARYDQAEKELVEMAARYIVYNFHTHNGLYYKYLIANCVALLIDVFTLFFIDFVLQNRFLSYGINAFPFNRDIVYFTDYMSETFPPFATCSLDKTNQLTAKRTEILGCHLTFMELYEKLFLVLWVWLYFLIAVTLVYIICLILLSLPFFHKFLLRTAKSSPLLTTNQRVTDTILEVSSICKVGDIYLLYCIKRYFSHAMFFELLSKLSDHHKRGGQPYTFVPYVDKETQPMVKRPSDTLLRNRNQPGHHNMPTGHHNVPTGHHNMPTNPEYLQQLLSNPAAAQRPQQDAQQRTPLLKKGTSILID